MARRPSDYDELAPKGAPGRRLSRKPDDPKAKGPEPLAAPKARPPVDPRRPFTGHQADPASLSVPPDRTPARRAPFLVAGTSMVTGMTAALLVALTLAERWETPEPLPILSSGGPRHLTDAGYSGTIVDDVPPPSPERDDPGPQPGPIKIFTSSERRFVSIEVDCPSSGFSRRGRFFPEGEGKMAATVPRVPPGEKCRVTFQGTEAATTWAHAHDTRECVTFNPTVCPER